MENLKEKTSKGLFWSILNNGSAQFLNLVFGIVLARLLTPEDYGIIGVLTIFTAVAAALQSSGFNTGLINLKNPQDNDYNSVFWFNVIASWILYLILFFCAPLIALFFHQSCLVSLSRLVFLTLPISALGISNGAFMTKNMMNREMALLAVSSLLLSGCTGILMALKNYGYWSLAVQQLTYTTINNLGRFYFVSWRPSLTISFEPVKKMFRFCFRILLTHIANTLNQHLLTFIFGRLYPIHIVGNYFQANKWNTMAYSTIQNSIGQVSQTVLVSVVDEEERDKRVFRKLLRFTAFISFPIIFGLALVSKEFILITVGEKWLNSVPLLQILCMGGAFSPFYILYQHLIISKRRSDLYMWISISQIVIQIIAAFSLYKFGLYIVVLAYSLICISWLFIWQYEAKKLIGITLLETLKDICPFMLAAIGIMLVTYYCTQAINNNWLLLGTRFIIVAVLYFLIMKLLGAEILNECLMFLKKKRREE